MKKNKTDERYLSLYPGIVVRGGQVIELRPLQINAQRSVQRVKLSKSISPSIVDKSVEQVISKARGRQNNDI